MIARLKKFALLSVALFSIVSIVERPQAAWGQFDQVFPYDGPSARGSIETIGPDEVVIASTRGKQTFAINEVRRIFFRDEPSKLGQAREAAHGGQYQKALDDLAAIDAADVPSEAVRQEIAWYKAFALSKLALGGSGDLKAAGVALRDFLVKHPKSWRYYEANELFGDMAVAAGSYEGATGYYQKLAAAPWPDFKLRAGVLESRALMHQGKFAEALPKLEEVLADTTDSPQAARQRTYARIDKIKCLAETGKVEEGIQIAEEIIANNSSEDTELFAGAYNALGACHLKASRPKEARLAYLHTDLLFSQEQNAEAHAEALYHLSKLWTQANKTDRAVQARETLKEKYAGSPWASKQ